MSERRVSTPTLQDSGTSKAGWQMPQLGGVAWTFSKILMGCLAFTLICIAVFTVAGWWGLNEVKSALPARPVIVRTATDDPLNCAAKGMWSVKLNGHYSCTAKFK